MKMSDFKCPLADKKLCPDHELYHYAANKIAVEDAQRLMKISELETQLETAYDEIKQVIEEMKKLTWKQEIKKVKDELKDAGSLAVQ